MNRVSVLMGSDSDWDVMSEARVLLDDFGVTSDLNVLSAHRSPDLVREYVLASEKDSAVYIVGAGAAAHLAGVVAAYTVRPVIGVPLDSTALRGVDSLYATVQMPAGVPVATMAIGLAGVKNAALFALEILAVSSIEIRHALLDYRTAMREKIIAKNKNARAQ